MTYAATVKFIVAMLIMMNPLGSLSIFLQLTHRSPVFHQQRTAIVCAISVATIMMISLWFGVEFLDLLGITLSSFRFAGGIIVFMVGLSMLQSQESAVSHTPEDDIAAEKRDSIAVVPLAIPIIMGPGTITALVLASNDYPVTEYKLWLSFWCLVLALGLGLVLYFGAAIAKFIGESVIKVITRIMGMIVMSIAVGMLANGLIGLIPALR